MHERCATDEPTLVILDLQDFDDDRRAAVQNPNDANASRVRESNHLRDSIRRHAVRSRESSLVLERSAREPL